MRQKSVWKGENVHSYLYVYPLNNHNGAVTHLEPDTSECEVMWAWGSISTKKASGGDGILAELLQILKDDAGKVLYSINSKFGKLSSGQRTGKSWFSFQSQRGQCQRMFKLPHNCTHFTASKVIPKSFKQGFSNTWTKNFQIFKLDLEKAEESEIKLPKFIGS